VIAQSWISSRGRELFRVSVTSAHSGSTETETKSAIAAAKGALDEAGLETDQIVRSRIWARDAEARRQASDVRRAALAGTSRGASASFIDPARLPEHSTMMIDLVALKTPGLTGDKIIAEYDPPVAPPEFVTLDGMVFLSGNTDSSAGFAQQLRAIRTKIENGMRRADAPWDKIVQVSAFVSLAEDQAGARRKIAALMGGLRCPLLTSAVAGFSSPEKLVEIEVTVDLKTS
jgi:enamine deaminase RidA (YjgF/YER057c/UK114 family)